MPQKKPPAIRVPNFLEYASYDGMHCNLLWKDTSDSWQCPACGRTKFQLLNWGKRVGSNAAIYGPVGWKTALHSHHDRGVEYGLPKRFDVVVVCNSCSTANGTIKRKLLLPKWFSFSPSEINQFVTATPHSGHVLDCDKAKVIADDYFRSSSHPDGANTVIERLPYSWER